MSVSRPRTSTETKSLSTTELDGPLTILTGTRPGIIKFAPIFHELDRRGIEYVMIHSDQHYSPSMDAVFFEDLSLRTPDHRLTSVARNARHGEQTADMLRGIETILVDLRPRLFLVGGDSNTHLAGAIAARKLHINLGHVEAGMRSYDWRMPEEHNRVMIDHISEHLFVHDDSAVAVLRGENVRGAIHVVGTTIADATAGLLAIAKERSDVLSRLRLREREFSVLTTHREENVDDGDALREILTGVDEAMRRLELTAIFAAHPRTVKRMGQFGIDVTEFPRVVLTEPFGYLDFLRLVGAAAAVITDSGGLQQEACILHVPCVTLRPSTEWTQTIDIGANRLAAVNQSAVVAAVVDAVTGDRSWPDPFPTGAARRLVDVVCTILTERKPEDAA